MFIQFLMRWHVLIYLIDNAYLHLNFFFIWKLEISLVYEVNFHLTCQLVTKRIWWLKSFVPVLKILCACCQNPISLLSKSFCVCYQNYVCLLSESYQLDVKILLSVKILCACCQNHMRLQSKSFVPIQYRYIFQN